MINIGIIGCGYWGPNLIRNFSSLRNCNVKKVCDLKPGRLEFVKKEFPFLETTKNYKNIINDKSIQAVCIATPVTTHKDLAEKALLSGKHVFIEKPLAHTSEDALSLVKLSSKLNKKLAVGHVFQFAPAVRKIKSLLKSKAIGKVLHISSTRINLGPPHSEVDVVWDLGPHDFSIILYLLEETPYEVNCIKNSYPFNQHNKSKLRSKNELNNNAHIDLSFKSGTTAHVHLSWLSSNKVRLMQIFGTEGSIIYDEMLALDGKLKLYGKGVDIRNKNKNTFSSKLSYNSGDILILQLEQHEPLRLECEVFIESILNNTPLVNDGIIGLEVVKLLETSSRSFNT
ncbi:MAG: Gfo/Idh/MocA family protein [Ignavibacteria bacterium]